MSVLFNVPEAISSEILSLWIDEITLTHLDSSICNKEIRRNYLDMIAHHTFHGEFSINCTDKVASNWFGLRNFSIKKLSLFQIQKQANLLLFNASEIESLLVADATTFSLSSTKLIEFLGACVKLDSLIVHNIGCFGKLVTESHPKKLSLFNQLTKLTITNDDTDVDIDMELLANLSPFCSNLVVFTYVNFISSRMERVIAFSLPE